MTVTWPQAVLRTVVPGVTDWHLPGTSNQLESLCSSAAGPWDCDVTGASYYHELLLTGKAIGCLLEKHCVLWLLAGWVGHFWRTSHHRCPLLCFVLGDERRQLVCLPNDNMACVGITWVSVSLSVAIMKTRGRVLRQLWEHFTHGFTCVAKQRSNSHCWFCSSNVWCLLLPLTLWLSSLR